MTISLTEVNCSAGSTYVKGASTKGARIGSLITSNTYTKGACTKVAIDVSVYIKFADLEGACIGRAFIYTGATYIRAWGVDDTGDLCI